MIQANKKSTCAPIPAIVELQREVLVVGAGPVGMASALALRAQGHSVTILEAESETSERPGSRAIFVHRESLELLEQVRPGLGWRTAANGLVWLAKRTFWRGREIYVRHYGPSRPGKWPPFTSLPQTMLEGLLRDACKAAEVEFVWNERVSAIESNPACVTVGTESGSRWKVKYLVGADGSRSAVRRGCKIPMKGGRSAHAYVVVDVVDDPSDPLPNERVFHYEHPGVGKRNVLLVPFKGGWRIDLQCHENDDPADFSGREGVRRWLPHVMPAGYADRVSWVSTYQFMHSVAQRFTDEHHRVLLVGEAAHLFAPFGARGMNSGFADAIAAATAIDVALGSTNSAEADQAIDHFVRTRGAAAEHNQAASHEALMHMQAQGPVRRVKRVIAGLLAPYVKRAGVWLDAGPYGPRNGPSGSGGGGKY